MKEEVLFYICPECGAEVRVNPAGCPKCAADRARKHWPAARARKAREEQERKPWDQDEVYDGLDLPDEEFDYDEFVEREFRSGGRGGGSKRQRGKQKFWAIAGLVVLVLIILAWVVMPLLPR